MKARKDEVLLKHNCGCIYIFNGIRKNIYSHYLCPIHYKLVANFNATHKVREAYLIKCRPRWTLID